MHLCSGRRGWSALLVTFSRHMSRYVWPFRRAGAAPVTASTTPVPSDGAKKDEPTTPAPSKKDDPTTPAPAAAGGSGDTAAVPSSTGADAQEIAELRGAIAAQETHILELEEKSTKLQEEHAVRCGEFLRTIDTLTRIGAAAARGCFAPECGFAPPEAVAEGKRRNTRA